MHIYCLDEMATKDSDSSKYQSTTCSLLDLSSLAISTSVIVSTSSSCPARDEINLVALDIPINPVLSKLFLSYV
jgi:hypothetical protein